MKKFTYSTFFILFTLILMYCKPMKPEGEGVTGTVTWLEGNQMPGIIDEDSETEKNPKGVGVKRTLLIYPLTNVADTKNENGLFTSVSGTPVTTIETEEDGSYQLQLAPGRYSVFTQEENGLFANIFDGDGYIQPITIKENEWNLLDIIINYKAVF
ncbi:carboxypeptidase regulatory-like domain-containing protein [Algoriphagus sp. PAP.12]|uniref:carboxypeptidase regulatory-like domain-containing protein n=1 Tax=Algoriphagus sp. PAP.12 TaxID=2996678 RepID=UPI00227A6FFB|nr:carboxypeptidase regulatory-like domain-containing protein [Algoriphagus sp. PAP.12]